MNSVSRSRRRRLSAAAIMGAIALTATACGGGGGSGEGDTVVIGYTGPLSGGGAAYGENVKIGLEMAIDDLNADGVEVDGNPVTLELKSLDDKYAPSTAASNAQRLADQDKAPVVVPRTPEPSRRFSRSTAAGRTSSSPPTPLTRQSCRPTTL